MSTYVVSDPLLPGGLAPPATQSAVSAAQQLLDSGDIVLVSVGDSPPTQVPEGVSKIVWCKSSTTPVPETIAAAVQTVVSNNSGDADAVVVVGTSTKFGSTVIPYAAALLQSSPITDIISIESKGTCV